MFIYDIETAANELSEAFFAKKEYAPDSALSTVDEPPSKITELKNDEMRNSRLAEWRTAQAAKIQANIDGKRKADADKAALHWWTGKVICIGVADLKGNCFVFQNKDEQLLLVEFFNYMIDKGHGGIGKASERFDRPFLIGRAMHHDIGIPDIWRPTHPINDVEQIWSHRSHRDQVGSLENIAWGLCLEAKGGKGSDVADWYKAGNMQQITDYCAQDVRLTAQIFARWEKRYERI